jgi:hypothetical protein
MSELTTVRLSSELLRRAQRLTAQAQRSPQQRPVAERLAATVVRPLGLDGPDVLDQRAAAVPDQPQPDEQWFDELWQLTLDATAALAVQDVSGPFREAVAGLQHLSLSSDGDAASRDEHSTRLQSLLGHLEAAVVVVDDGPYLTTNVDRVSDWLGQESVLTAGGGPVPLRRLAGQAVVRRRARRHGVLRATRPRTVSRTASTSIRVSP